MFRSGKLFQQLGCFCTSPGCSFPFAAGRRSSSPRPRSFQPPPSPGSACPEHTQADFPVDCRDFVHSGGSRGNIDMFVLFIFSARSCAWVCPVWINLQVCHTAASSPPRSPGTRAHGVGAPSPGGLAGGRDALTQGQGSKFLIKSSLSYSSPYNSSFAAPQVLAGSSSKFWGHPALPQSEALLLPTGELVAAHSTLPF